MPVDNADVDEYFTADDPNYAERLNNPNILMDIFTIKPRITLPGAFNAGVYPTTENKTKALFSIVQVINNTCTNTGDGFTASADNQSFTLRVYPNFSAFKWWNSITWTGTGTITCKMKDTETGTVLISDIANGANLNSYNIAHKQVDIIFTLANGARVTDITFEYQNQAKLTNTQWTIPKDNITGLNDELSSKADESTVDSLTTVVTGKADKSYVDTGLATKLNSNNYTAADVLAKLLIVAGSGSNLDADKLDGNHASAFLLAAAYTAADILAKLKTVAGPGSRLDADTLDGAELATINNAIAAKLNISTYTAADVLAKLLTVAGAGSNLDADKLDGQHGSYYLPLASYTAADILSKLKTIDGVSSGLDADLLDGIDSDRFMYTRSASIPASIDLNTYQTTGIYYQASNANAENGTNYPVAQAGSLEVLNVNNGSFIYQRYITYSSSGSVGANVYTRSYYNNIWTSWKTNWNNANDGAGSGLDADLLDGMELATINANIATKLNASAYTAADVLAKLLTVGGANSGLDADKLDGNHASAFLLASAYTAADILNKLKTVDGASSGLDADLLDGQQGSYYLPASSYTASDVLAKLLTVDGAGKGIDADLLDGQHGSYYAPASDRRSGWVHLDGFDIDSGSAVASYVFSGLNINPDDEIKVVYTIMTPSASARTLQLMLNNATHSVNQRYGSTSVAGTGFYMGYFAANGVGKVFGKLELKIADGSKQYSHLHATIEQYSGYSYVVGGDTGVDSIPSITSLGIKLDSGTFYGKCDLYKWVD